MRRIQCLPQSALLAAMEVKNRLAAMARGTETDVSQLKGTKIFVTVEEALVDVLVVSFRFGPSIFQGALLDVTKKNSPFGVSLEKPWDNLTTGMPTEPMSPARAPDQAEEKSDRFHALRQRQTYFQVDGSVSDLLSQPFFRTRLARNGKDKNVRMRRLRPRQVLCSQCRAICNENSENMQVRNTKKEPVSKSPTNGHVTDRSRCTTKVTVTLTDSLETRQGWQNRSVASQRVTLTSTSVQCVQKVENKSVSATTEDTRTHENKNGATVNGFVARTVSEYQAVASAEPSNRMILRKRRLDFMSSRMGNVLPNKLQKSPPASEDCLLKETPKTQEEVHVSLIKSPVIKISFANPQGKDTVLKIPSRLQSCQPSDTDEDGKWAEKKHSELWSTKDAGAKAAKKALKKAKKEAQKKITKVLSPNRETDVVLFQRHKHHHHHHKHKRKRKHRENGQRPENLFSFVKCSSASSLPKVQGLTNQNNMDINHSESLYEEVKNRCLKQKLSINLKRLNAKAYMRCSPKYSPEEVPIDNGSSGSGSECGEVPDFPNVDFLRDLDRVKPLMMRISTHNVKKCLLDGGREMAVGDIVWGKIHGFPWWPGKVLALTVSQRDNGVTINQQAHVAWFGSSTSSYMPCHQLTPFLNDFKIRYNKKKRGPYKEAIRQATMEAQRTDQAIMIHNEVRVVS